MEEFKPPAAQGIESHWPEGLRQALSRFAGLSPHVAAARSDCQFEGGHFVVPLLHRRFAISHPDGQIKEVGLEKPPPIWLHILLLHYLLTADGTAVADSWIAYRHLPGATFFEGRFNSMAVRPLLEKFGQDLVGFRRAGMALGGAPMSRTGDAAFRFLVLPSIPMAGILYLGDDEMPPSLTLLFDASSPHYLPTEDLSILGAYLSRALISAG